jgi:acyl carrier protein
MDTFTTIQRLAIETLDVQEEPLLRAKTLKEAGIDSLAAIDLVFAIEARFGIAIPAEDLSNVRSLRDLAVVADRLISRKTHGRDESP